jgi:hypothetical protein
MDGTARVWKVPSGQSRELGTHLSYLNDAVLSPDGRHVATAVGNPALTLQGAEPFAWVLSVKQKKAVLEHKYPGDRAPIQFAAFSPGGAKYLVALDGSPNPLLFDLRSKEKKPTTLPGHFGAVTSVAFSCDGQFLLTSSIDDTVRVWDLTVPFQDLAQGMLAVLPAPKAGQTHLVAQILAAQGLVAPGAASPVVPQAAISFGLAPLAAPALPLDAPVPAPVAATPHAVFGPGNKSVLVIGHSNTARIYTCEICGSLDNLAAAARKILEQRGVKPK